MTALKILYVASEVDLFLETTAVARVVHTLAKAMRAEEVDVRVFVPRFGVINERRNRIHEVVRMGGTNITLQGELYPLAIKVSSIREERLQVYFIDNDELFKKKFIYHDKTGNLLPNNTTKALFFCKSVIAAVEQLEWSPDVVHCHGWITALLPYLIKEQASRAFTKAKTIFSLYEDAFVGEMGKAPLEEIGLNITPDFAGWVNLGRQYADMTTKNCLAPPQVAVGTEGISLPLPQTPALTAAYTDEAVRYVPEDESLVETYVSLYHALHGIK